MAFWKVLWVSLEMACTTSTNTVQRPLQHLRMQPSTVPGGEGTVFGDGMSALV